MSGRNVKNAFEFRSSLLAVFLCLLFVVLAAKLFYLQVLQGAELKKAAEAQHSIYQKLLPSRGEIDMVDKASSALVPLATNVKSYLVYAVPSEVLNPGLAAASLAGVLQLDSKDILGKITQTDKKYVIIKKQLTDAEQSQIKQLALAGIFFDSEDTRVYPQNSLLSQTVGFLGYSGKNPNKTGLYGLERYFNQDLSGSSGQVTAQKDSGGAMIYGAGIDREPALDGANLILTIDQTIQFQAESMLKDMVDKNGADSGSIIVANPKTGAILALAGYPNFDPNQYNTVANPADFNNQTVTGNYEPGSVFKAITMAAALDENKVTATSTYVDTGDVAVGGFHIHNSDNKAHGLTTMTQVLDWSYNTGAVYAENQLGNPDFLKYVNAFGFGQATGIELPETKGSLDGLKGNNQTNYDTASFGQGILVTPMQMLQAYTAFANGGKMMKPYIIQSEIFPDGKIVDTKPTVVKQVISPQTASTLDAMLVDVVENGYGAKAAVPGYFVAGKTGTAQVAGPDGKYLVNDNIGSFIGFAPVDNPQFVMLIRVDHPRDAEFSETTAVPVWGKLAQFILNYMGIPPSRPIPANKQ
ncbi:MAG: penicillin-binding protein 2 [Candidatus Doudnabacteria bacterium]|nr:penicillin-binding protein 2 [Candidatus Doudnabacteria bacterium]